MTTRSDREARNDREALSGEISLEENQGRSDRESLCPEEDWMIFAGVLTYLYVLTWRVMNDGVDFHCLLGREVSYVTIS